MTISFIDEHSKEIEGKLTFCMSEEFVPHNFFPKISKQFRMQLNSFDYNGFRSKKRLESCRILFDFYALLDTW